MLEDQYHGEGAEQEAYELIAFARRWLKAIFYVWSIYVLLHSAELFRPNLIYRQQIEPAP